MAGIKDRRMIRLRGYDYSDPGMYFVTICTQNRVQHFGQIADGCMRLSAAGEIARVQWEYLPHRFPVVELDDYVIMPNHFHGLLRIVRRPSSLQVGQVTRRFFPFAKPGRADRPPLGEAVRAFKGATSYFAHKVSPQFAWQYGYYESIVTSDTGLNRIREYIRNNPARWEEDKLYTR